MLHLVSAEVIDAPRSLDVMMHITVGPNSGGGQCWRLACQAPEEEEQEARAQIKPQARVPK